ELLEFSRDDLKHLGIVEVIVTNAILHHLEILNGLIFGRLPDHPRLTKFFPTVLNYGGIYSAIAVRWCFGRGSPRSFRGRGLRRYVRSAVGSGRGLRRDASPGRGRLGGWGRRGLGHGGGRFRFI